MLLSPWRARRQVEDLRKAVTPGDHAKIGSKRRFVGARRSAQHEALSASRVGPSARFSEHRAGLRRVPVCAQAPMLRSDSCSQCVSAPAPRFADPQSSPAMTGRQAVRRGMNVQVGPHDFAAVLRINSDAVPLRQWGQPLKTKAAVPAPYTSVGFVAGEALQREVCSRNRRRQEKAEAERCVLSSSTTRRCVTKWEACRAV